MYINNEINYLKYLKNKKVFIFGASFSGLNVLHKLEQKEIDVKAFIDNSSEKQKERWGGVRVISLSEMKEMNDKMTMIVICSKREFEIKEQLLKNDIYNFVSCLQIDLGGGEEYYDEDYFTWQSKIGEFGAVIKEKLFSPYVEDGMTVVEFGCGGGYLLQRLSAKEKLGIEINAAARKKAEEIGIKTVKNISEVDNDFADIIISNSVLEHVENPLGCLRELREKLKDGGKIVFFVPNERCETEYERNEINNHLYTWNCLNIGNLFKAAGFFVHSVERIQEVWPKKYLKLWEQLSEEMFEELCRVEGKVYEENRCLIVAYK